MTDAATGRSGPCPERRLLLSAAAAFMAAAPLRAAGAPVPSAAAAPSAREPIPGLDPTGAADATEALQRALDARAAVAVPPGTYRISGTIRIAQQRALLLDDGVTLRRPAEDPSQAPLVQLEGGFAVLAGRAWIRSERPSPRGVVRVGPRDERPANINWASISGIAIQGDAGRDSVGLAIESSGIGGKGSNYNGRYEGIHVRDVGIGVRVAPVCNANTFTNLFFYKIGRCSYLVEDATENCAFGGFTHYCADLTAVIEIRGGSYNHFYGVSAEPGGKQARYFELDERTLWNLIIGQENCHRPAVDRGRQNAFFTGRELRVGKVSTKHLQVEPEPGAPSADSQTFVCAGAVAGARLSGLRPAAEAGPAAGLFYEITVSGARPDGRAYAGRFLVTAAVDADGKVRHTVDPLIPARGVTAAIVDPQAGALALGFEGFASPPSGSALVEVRRSGIPARPLQFTTVPA